MTSVLSYPAAAGSWLECLPLGNGRLGAMLDGGFPATRIGLNDETAWSGSPASESASGLISAEDAAEAVAESRAAIAADDPVAAARALQRLQVPYSQAYLPFASLVLTRTGARTPDYVRLLDLMSGIHETRCGGIREYTLASAVHGVLAHRIENAESIDLALESPHRELRRVAGDGSLGLIVRLPSDVAPTHDPGAPPVTWSDARGAALEGAVAVTIRRESGATLVVVATETTFAGAGTPPEGDGESAFERARARAEAAAALGWSELRDAHEADFVPRMTRTRVHLGAAPTGADGAALHLPVRLERAFASRSGTLQTDPALAELLFDFGRYLLLSSSRPGGLPPTLQGIWNDELRPPWSSNYTLNINLQMNHWAAHVTDLSESAEPLLQFVQDLAERGNETAARLYGTRGWVAHHNSDAWLLTHPVGGGHGDARWSAWPLASLWLVMHIADAVEFGAISDARLHDLWPAVRGAARFAVDWVHEDAEGRWITSPATSPENAFVLPDGRVGAVDETTTMDLALIREALRTAMLVADRLGIDPSETQEMQALLVRLPSEPRVGGDGAIAEWSRDRTAEDAHHRHLSHLVGLYPGTARWSDEARRAATVTLTTRGDDSSGWSLIWKALLWARLGRGERTGAVLELLFRDAQSATGPWAGGLYPNLFAAHPPFQIDANLGFPAVLAEAILQSHDGIELLPALPPAFRNGAAHGLVARPGVRVHVEWREGDLVRATLQARPGVDPGSLRLRYRGSEISRPLGAGETIELSAADFRVGKS
ncbi:glycoside hydrolase family 95 protein [Microbacterium sp. HD4P20]|uniref:glycosyl hydrolase family 95 catalytic domain-containing protein n=1 Tax=Microbacterium sp. HD4P20 TaxID=2864874 RepID=UPI001C643E1D|nr:glycoside hydrolase N-terminal domain-containing protein [Microbacterium sp. HD4P20]MCP2636184.1 glycoside hydrolase family 95 protein [Microbacterium sp. HD4P20]